MIKIFLDTSVSSEILDAYKNNKNIKGFTTNPSLMKKAGVSNYINFLKQIMEVVKDAPISFEVFADDLLEMEKQAVK